MSDETQAPGEGEGGGLPPDVETHRARMEDPAWKERLKELEVEVHRALAALFEHAQGAAAVSVPVQLEDGSVRAVVAGDPIAVFAAIQGEGPKLLLNKHVIVGSMNPKEFLLREIMGLLSGRMRGGGDGPQDDDEECDCPACVAERANPH